MRANMELLDGEPMDSIDILRSEISHLGQKFDEEVGALKDQLANAERERDEARAQVNRLLRSYAEPDFEAHQQIVTLSADLAARDARIAELEVALKTFAHFGRFCNPNSENYDDNKIFSSVHLKCGMFRRAREVMEKRL